ncbi:transposase [Teredinibacter turnerae]
MARRKHYNSYDDDFKATAVALTEIPGVQANHVAEALDIHEVMLYRWRMEM